VDVRAGALSRDLQAASGALLTEWRQALWCCRKGGVVQNGRFMGYTESGQSRANQGIPRFACNPDLNHAEVPSERQSRFWAFASGMAGYAALLLML